MIKKSLLVVIWLVVSAGHVALSQIIDPRQDYALELLNNMAGGRYNDAVSRFDSVMSTRMPAETLQQVWEALQKQVGKYLEYQDYRLEDNPPYHSIYLVCRFEKTLLDMKVVFNRHNEIAGLFFLPSRKTAWEMPGYVDTTKFYRKSIEVISGEFHLPGELTIPRDTNEFPVVVLVHGSGPNDMDETIWSNKVFRDLAWGLSSRGIGVLRYNKRTYQYGNDMDPGTVSVREETIEDAIAAIKFAEKQEGCSGVFLLGHSLGGFLAPWIASETDALKGMIILAGNTRPLEDLILEQVEYIFGLDGLSHEDSLQISELAGKVSLVKSRALSDTTPGEMLPLGIPGKYWLSIRDYHPAEVAAKLNLPILVLQGEADYQVTMKDFQGWKEALAGTGKAEFHALPKVNHLFMKGGDKSTPADYYHTNHVSPEVINLLVQWFKQQY